MTPQDSTRIGYLLGPYGVRGGVKLFVLGDEQQLLKLGRAWVEGFGWLRIKKVEQLYPGVALFFQGIESREIAADLRGANVYAHDDELPELEEGSYYYHQLRGLAFFVEEAEGQPAKQIGEVVDILDMGHQDLLVVSHEYGESQIPLQAPYVVIEHEAGYESGHKDKQPKRVILTAEAPKGLLGDEEE